jgi:error-prone DNA polymerase
MGIRVAARGSGAASMVNHSLFVATANPLEHRLWFEWFLSERRTSLADIDLPRGVRAAPEGLRQDHRTVRD